MGEAAVAYYYADVAAAVLLDVVSTVWTLQQNRG